MANAAAAVPVGAAAATQDEQKPHRSLRGSSSSSNSSNNSNSSSSNSVQGYRVQDQRYVNQQLHYPGPSFQSSSSSSNNNKSSRSSSSSSSSPELAFSSACQTAICCASLSLKRCLK
ncbi:hypothetical protein ETH_00032830, partial [Eimeria tenella]